jgi:uncharacterized OsmC-like protein
LVAEGRGEIEKEDGVLVIRRIHVRYRLQLAPEQEEAAQRAHNVHVDACPVARTIRDCVRVTTSLEMEWVSP